PAAIDELSEIAKRHNLLLIEDAACAIGSMYKGRRIGQPHAWMSIFSFHPRKILTTGAGGMISTLDENVAERSRRRRQHAMSVSDVARHSAHTVITEQYDEVGFNFRMTDLQAAVGIVQLSRVEGFIERRRKFAARYTEELSRIGWLIPPAEPEG